MAESDTHREQIIYLIEALKDYFRDVPDVYVAGNLFVYYREDDPTKVVAPDVFVVLGVPKRQRRIYQVWKEGKAPDVVFEITSRSTRREDLGAKKNLYERLGVREYFLFDPLGEYLQPHLMGFELREGRYRRLGGWPLVSAVLGLELWVEGTALRLVNPEYGEKLLSPSEAMEAYRLAEGRAAAEAEARRRLEIELEQLRAELARLRGGD